MANENVRRSFCLGTTFGFFFPESVIMFSNNSTHGSRLPPETQHLAQFISCMQAFLIPTLSILGILGSVFCCTVLLKTRLLRKFYTHFLVCTSSASGGFLLTVMTTWMSVQGIDVYRAPGLCQVVVFSSHFFPFLACWSTLIGAFLILWDSLQARTVPCMNSPGKAKAIIVAISFFGFTIYSYKTWTNGTILVNGYRICTVLPENEEAMALLNILDIMFLLVVPSVFFLVFDIMFIIAKVSGNQASDCSRRHNEVMKIVVAHSITFHLLGAPSGISMLIFIANRWVSGNFPSYNEILTQQVFQYLFYAYFAVLPFLPLFTSAKFRFYLLLMLGFKPSRRKRKGTLIRRQPSFL